MVIFLLAAGGFMFWFNNAAEEVNALYASVSAQLASEPTHVGTARTGDFSINIPSWELFSRGDMWSFVGKQRTLPSTYAPQLATVSVEHTSGSNQVARSIVSPLQSLFAAAAADGSPLMLSSAYRSTSDQQAIYDAYLKMYGQKYVDSYVALPGASEHQSGLSVDIASKSNECARSAAGCSLDYEAIVWLADNATHYGFIQRYPAGKQSITGIAGEAWHYRYVGTALASFLTSTGMTFDEFVQQIAPGYAN